MNETATEDLGAPLPLSDFASVENAPKLKDALLRRRGGDLVVDGSNVEILSGIALEVLVSARETWRLDGVAMTFASPSDQMKRDIGLLGAAELLIDACMEKADPDLGENA